MKDNTLFQHGEFPAGNSCWLIEQLYRYLNNNRDIYWIQSLESNYNGLGHYLAEIYLFGEYHLIEFYLHRDGSFYLLSLRQVNDLEAWKIAHDLLLQEEKENEGNSDSISRRGIPQTE